MGNWEDEKKAGSIPPPPPTGGKNTTYSVVIDYGADSSKEYERVRKVNMNPGFMVLQWSDREAIIPLTSAVRSIEISEDAILS
jgi:hypothetical protein